MFPLFLPKSLGPVVLRNDRLGHSQRRLGDFGILYLQVGLLSHAPIKLAQYLKAPARGNFRLKRAGLELFVLIEAREQLLLLVSCLPLLEESLVNLLA